MTATKVETFKEWLKDFKENNKKRKWNHKYYWNESKKIFLASIIVFSLVSCKKDESTTINENKEHLHYCTIVQTFSNGVVNTIVIPNKLAIESDITSYVKTNSHLDSSLVQTCDCVDK